MRRAAALLAGLALAGCGYLRDRVHDAEDVFHFDVSLGPQLGATIRLTHLAQAGVQVEGGRTGSGPEDRVYDTGHLAWNGRWAGIYKRFGHEGGIGPESIEPHWYKRSYSAEYEEEYRDQPRTPDEFGFSLAILLVGFEIGFRPVELFDFFTGFIGVDMLKDDNRPGVSEDSEKWLKERESHDGSEHEGEWRPRPKPVEPPK